jgi:hypothetical protein
MGVNVTVQGPLLDGSAPQIVAAGIEEAVRTVAEAGETAVQNRLQQVLRHETGKYRSKIITDRVSEERWDITDQGYYYGPWLEGTGSRNKTTRFKGYGTFRKTTQWLQDRAPALADAVFSRYVEQLGGE